MTEHIQPTTRPQTKEVSRPNWSAVFSVAFCVACLITVEFLPVSLLTPMAQDLGISVVSVVDGLDYPVTVVLGLDFVG